MRLYLLTQLKTAVTDTTSPDMLPEYHFDYSQARPNRFAGRISEERVVVVLDPEVSQVFPTLEAVKIVSPPE